MTKEQKHTFWKQHIHSWLQSQTGRLEFCQQHGLSYSQFCYWRTRLNKTREPSSRKLIPVVMTGSTRAAVCVSLPHGIVLDVPVHATG